MDSRSQNGSSNFVSHIDLESTESSIQQVALPQDVQILVEKMVKKDNRKAVPFDEPFLFSRCGKFRCGSLYLDLTGRYVEVCLKRRIEDTDLSCICGYLKKNPKIIYLNLSYNSLTANGFAFLAYYLADDENLRSLNLVHNDIVKISESVIKNTSPLWKLKCLTLTGNKFGKEGGVQIANLLKHNASIVHLDIGETDQNVQSTISIIESLLPHLNQNHTLKKIDLARLIPDSRMRRLDSSYFCRFFSYVLLHNKSLTEIHLAKNEIGDLDLELLAEGLYSNRVLDLLDLTSNRLTSHGMELLASVLPETKISCLVVTSNRVGNDGAIALGKVFSKTNLRILDVSYNNIEDCGFTCLLEGMKSRKPHFHKFFFFGNPISTETLNQTFGPHLCPTVMNIKFIWENDELIFKEDVSAGTYRSSHFSVASPDAKKLPIIQSYCH